MSSLNYLRNIFVSSSKLRLLTRPNMDSILQKDRACFHQDSRPKIKASLDLDGSMREDYPNQNRWDYLLAINGPQKIIAVEPHSAKDSEISRIIKKKTASKVQLHEHLCRESYVIERWYWVSSGKFRLSRMDKVKRQLDKAGIEFVGKPLSL